MKFFKQNFFSLFFIISIVACNQQGNNKELSLHKKDSLALLEFDTLNYKTLAKLFNSADFDSLNNIVCTPDFVDKVNKKFVISFDGKLHVGIDTIIYSSKENHERAIVVFSTQHQFSETGISYCSNCHPENDIAVFKKNQSDNWIVKIFKKNIASVYFKVVDDKGAVNVDNIGIKITSELDGSFNYSNQFTEYFDFDLNKIFRFNNYFSNAAPDSLGYDFNAETNMKILPRENGIFDIELSTKTVRANEANKDTIRTFKKRLFSYSDEQEYYMEVK